MADRPRPYTPPAERRRGEFAEESELLHRDRPASSTTGRQREPADTRSPDEMPPGNVDAGEFEPGEMEPDDLWKSTRTKPLSEVTDRPEETEDGLDETAEAVRREAEDHPPGRGS